MTRPAVIIDARSRWPLARRLALGCAALGAVAVVTWWAMTPATAEHAPAAQPAKAQWAGSASPFAAVSAGATTLMVSTSEPPAAAVTPPAAPPAQTLDAPGAHVTPMSAPTGLAGARGGAEAPDTEAEN